MYFLTIFLASCLRNLPINDTREVPIILLLLTLYHKQCLCACCVLKEPSFPPSTRRESLCWNSLLRTGPKDIEHFLDSPSLSVRTFQRYHLKVKCATSQEVEDLSMSHIWQLCLQSVGRATWNHIVVTNKLSPHCYLTRQPHTNKEQVSAGRIGPVDLAPSRYKGL